jgi:signal transduction histidine kinase
MGLKAGRGRGASLAGLCEGLQRAADEERRRLARQLHDSTAQTLSAAAMNLTLVACEAAALTPAARQALDRAQELVAGGCRELGELAHRLHPPLLGESGLAAALRWLVARDGGAGARVEIDGLGPLGAALENAVYRLVEDALAGALAPDGLLRARVSAGPAGAVLVSLEGPPRPGSQLDLATLALRQRVRAAGGQLRVRKGREQTRIEARFPPSAEGA